MENRTFEQYVEALPFTLKLVIEDLKNLRERPDYHPELSAFLHVQEVVTRLIKTGDIDLIMAGIFHDIFKKLINRTNEKTGYPTAPGHDKWAYDLIMENQETRDYIESFGGNPDNVAILCKEHMRVKQRDRMRTSKRQELENNPLFEKLLVFSRADDMLNEFIV